MSPSLPPLPSYLPSGLPPLAPRPAEIDAWVRQEQVAAKARGERAGRAGSALRRRFEAMGTARAAAVAAASVAAPDGVWMTAVRVGDDDLWCAVRPLGGGRVEAWDGRSEPQQYSVTALRPRPIRRSGLRLTLDDGLTRRVRVGTDRGAVSDVGLTATPWHRAIGGGDDPIAGLVLVLAGIWFLLTLPVRIGPARARARTRDALVAALRS